MIAALANGLGLAIGISTTMGVSGGAVNPAVTVGLFVAKKTRGRDAIPYIIAQLAGATLAGILLIAASPSAVGAAAWLPSELMLRLSTANIDGGCDGRNPCLWGTGRRSE